MASNTQTTRMPVLIVGVLLSASTLYWALMTSALPKANVEMMFDINGARYLSAFMVGILGAHIATLLMTDSSVTRHHLMNFESRLLLLVATLMATLAIYLHFGALWSVAGLTMMALFALLSTRPGLPQFVSNGITGFSWGVVIGAMVYLYMSSSNPVGLTQFLSGNFAQISLWQPIALAVSLVIFIAGHQQIVNRSGLNTNQLALLLMLLMVALVGIVPFIVSVALLTQRLIDKVLSNWRLLNYFLVGSVCLFIEAFSTSLLAGNSLPFGLTLSAVFVPIIMLSLATAERGWRFALNLLAILIVAAALWLVLLLNYANFIGQIV